MAASSTFQRLATTARRPRRLEGALQAQHPLATLQLAQSGLAGREDDQLAAAEVERLHLLGGQDAVLAGRESAESAGRRSGFAAAAGQDDARAQQRRQLEGEVALLVPVRRCRGEVGPRGGAAARRAAMRAGDSKKPWVARWTTRQRPPSSRRLISASVGSAPVSNSAGWSAKAAWNRSRAGLRPRGRSPAGPEAGPVARPRAGGERRGDGRAGPARVGLEVDVADGQQPTPGRIFRIGQASAAARPEAT